MDPDDVDRRETAEVAEPSAARVTPAALEAMREVVQAASQVLDEWQGRRSPSPVLAAIGALRASLRSLDALEEGEGRPPS
jgi:hypothetical protein